MKEFKFFSNEGAGPFQRGEIITKRYKLLCVYAAMVTDFKMEKYKFQATLRTNCKGLHCDFGSQSKKKS
jgi:hypothetical protein